MMIEMKRAGDCEVTIDPERFFHSRNNTVGRFRKIAALAVASDLVYGTSCVNEWLSVVDEYIELCITGMKQQDARRHKALEHGDTKAHKTAVNALKRVDAKRRKYLKYREMLDKEGQR